MAVTRRVWRNRPVHAPPAGRNLPTDPSVQKEVYDKPSGNAFVKDCRCLLLDRHCFDKSRELLAVHAQKLNFHVLSFQFLARLEAGLAGRADRPILNLIIVLRAKLVQLPIGIEQYIHDRRIVALDGSNAADHLYGRAGFDLGRGGLDGRLARFSL